MDRAQEKCQSPSVSEIRRERERAEMVARIMDVARDMFVRDGYEAVTLRKIAEAIEYSPGTIYQYFKDKQALFMKILATDYVDLRKNLSECLVLENPVEVMVEMARRYAMWGITHPNHYRLLLMPPQAWEEETQDLRKPASPTPEKQLFLMLDQAVKVAISRGMLKEKYTESAPVAATLWAGIHGVVMLEITTSTEEFAQLGGQDLSLEKRLDTLTGVFVDGFLKEKVKPRRRSNA